MTEKKTKCLKTGSALIMTVVLTVLLAIVAVMFVAVARMDIAATSNIADNKTLDLAAKSIIEIINKELIFDTPGVAKEPDFPKANYPQYYDYYDYPDACDVWLASLEPYESGGNYYWRQISDVTGYLRIRGFEANDVSVKPPVGSVIRDYPEITLDGSGNLQENWADADGDGIADSKWFELEDLHTSKGKPVYAAVRVIDTGGMINVNTACRFDANNTTDVSKIDGSTQMQLNLANMLKDTDSIDDLHDARCGGASQSWTDYEPNAVWEYNEPADRYLPFDISDELELRYRYCIDGKIISRLEVNLPATMSGFGWPNYGNLYDDPYPSSGGWGLDEWQMRITDTDPCDPNADRRHMLTTLNLDRIIDPCGVKMANINNASVSNLYNRIRRGILDADGNFPDVNEVSAQIAVNIKDFRDADSDVNYFDVGPVRYYGFERPCVYISELAYQYDGASSYWAIELYKPYSGDSNPAGWKLRVGGFECDVGWVSGQFHVIAAPGGAFAPHQLEDVVFGDGDAIYLMRNVNGTEIVVDSVVVPTGFVSASVPVINSVKRDITRAKCIRRIWNSVINNNPTLGNNDDPKFENGDSIYVQAHPKNAPFTNIGEIGMIFRKPAYYPYGDSNDGVIGYDDSVREEYQVRLNLADPNFQQIFKYLTVIDPYNFHSSDAAETRIKGRVNINTAPAFVLAQLPWVSLRNNPVGYNDPNLAEAIVAYRDKLDLFPFGPDYTIRTDGPGFESIGRLCDVNLGSENYAMDYYVHGTMGGDQTGFPDLTTPDQVTGDGAPNDFEERDLIFARISDLVTVRSDIFAAYILVRIGADGPQKRYTAILDRSRVKDPNDRVAVRAFQTTPEAR